MTGFLEVVGGAAPAGLRLQVNQGAALDVGRSAHAGLAADAVLAPRHFNCAMNSDGLLVSAVDRAESFLNGKRLGRALVKSGDWIQAGSTMFRVMIYRPYSSAVLDSPVETLVRTLLAEVDHLHAMFDVIDCGGIDRFLPQWRNHSIELAQSPEGNVIYLCSLRAMGEGIRPLLESGLGERYGIWICQDQPGLAKHLLRYLKRKRWFPFYQPAVILPFWESCPARSRQAFLGPASWIGVIEPSAENQLRRLSSEPSLA